jgi:hypothetical protein
MDYNSIKLRDRNASSSLAVSHLNLNFSETEGGFSEDSDLLSFTIIYRHYMLWIKEHNIRKYTE